MLSFLSDTKTLLALGVVFVVVYLISLAIYRLYFHPLARFPGPKLAALSKWYEFYYDVYLQGQFVFQLEELHKRYGPIVRITEDELHINDPDFFNEFLSKQGPQSKYAWSADRFNNATSTFSAITPDDHKIKRGALENNFSRTQVRKLLPILQENVAKMLSKIAEYQQLDKAVRLDRAFFAVSEDMIFEYGFGISRNAVDLPGFEGVIHEVFTKAGKMSPLMLQFPLIPKITNALPDWLVLKLLPDLLPIIQMRRGFNHEFDALEQPESFKSRSTRVHKTVMSDLLGNPDLPPSMKTRQRLIDEAQLVIGAGLSTAGWAATVGLYHIVANPEVLRRARADIFEQVPPGQKRRDCTDLDWGALESLPYFQACIREALRLSYGMSARTARVTPKDIIYTESVAANEKTDKGNTVVRSWQIPANTPVSMSIPLINHNEDIFPDSYKFKPERWLGPNKVPEKYFVSFSKGSRICMGMQLAWAELSLMLAGVVRWFDLDLYETDESAVRMGSDAGVPIPAHNNGLRAKVRAELD